MNRKNLQQTFPTIIQNRKRLRKPFPLSFKCIAYKTELYLKQLQTSSTKFIVVFGIIKKSLNRKNSQQTFPSIIQNWERLRKLFPVSFKCIVSKIVSYLRKIQTSSTKSVVLFWHYQKSLNLKNSQQTYPTIVRIGKDSENPSQFLSNVLYGKLTHILKDYRYQGPNLLYFFGIIKNH